MHLTYYCLTGEKMKQRLKEFFEVREHPEDPYYEEDEENMERKAFLKTAAVIAAILFAAGLFSSVVRSSSIASGEAERKAARTVSSETAFETYSPAEKESIQAEFDSAVSENAEAAADTVLKSRTFSVAVKGVSRIADFSKRVFRGEYINGYTYPEDSYLIEVPEGFETAKVLKVVDGDTLYAEIIGSNNPASDTFLLSSSEDQNPCPYIRLLNVNTEESVADDEYLRKTGKENTQFGKEASDYVRSVLKEGDVVYLSPDPGEFSEDKDKYGRYLRLVWNQADSITKLDPLNYDAIRECTLNADLVLKGYAETLFLGGNDTYRELFSSLQTEAMKNEDGMWSMVEK